MTINTADGLLQFQGRILPTPQLQYGRGSKELTVVCFFLSCMLPALMFLNLVRFQEMVNGTCKCFLVLTINNVLMLWRADKKLFTPVTINHWLIVTFDTRRFRDQAQQDLVKNLVNGFRSTGKLLFSVAKAVDSHIKGITMQDDRPIIRTANAQGNILQVGFSTICCHPNSFCFCDSNSGRLEVHHIKWRSRCHNCLSLFYPTMEIWKFILQSNSKLMVSLILFITS